MADSYIGVAVDGPGKKVDNTQVTTDVGDVQRQSISLADPATPAARARVLNLPAGATDYGTVVRHVSVLKTISGTLQFVDDTVVLPIPFGTQQALFQLSGDFSGTIIFQFSTDGSTWTNATVTEVTGYFLSSYNAYTFSNVGWDGSAAIRTFLFDNLLYGVTHVRAKITNGISGSVTVYGQASDLMYDLTRLAMSNGYPSSNGGRGWGGAALSIAAYLPSAAKPMPLFGVSGTISQFDNALATGIACTSSATAFNLRDKNAQGIDSATSAPSGSERGLITRNIPNGTQPVSGPLTDAQLRADRVPVNANGSVIRVAAQDSQSGWQNVPDALTLIIEVETYVARIIASNLTDVAQWLTVAEGNDALVFDQYPLNPRDVRVIDLGGAQFLAGVKWQASALNAIRAAIVGNTVTGG